MVPFRADMKARVRRELGNVTLVDVPDSTHMSIGVAHVDRLAGIVGGFLRGA